MSSWIKCHQPAIFLAAPAEQPADGLLRPGATGAGRAPARRRGAAGRRAARATGTARSSGGRRPAAPQPAGAPRPAHGQSAVARQARQAHRRSARRERAFADVEDLARRAALDSRELQALAGADALQGLAGHRRQQAWAAAGHELPPELLRRRAGRRSRPLALPAPPEGEEILLDYASLGLTLSRHPLALLRRAWRGAAGTAPTELGRLPDGRLARASGIVTMRQRPETAKGTIFVTLEDETGAVNVIVWRHVREAQRQPLLRARLLAVAGQWQSARACRTWWRGGWWT